MAAVSAGTPKLKTFELAPPRPFKDAVWPHLPSIFRDKKLRSEYRPQEFVGAGAFGRVYSVVNDKEERYACKVLDKQNFKNPQYRKRLINEIETLRKLPGHPHIVGFVQCFEDNAFVYIVMELCSSKSLDAIFKTRKCISEPEVRYFMYQLIDAVEHMHKYKVIHRDLKFANVLLTESMQVKVADFGLSAMLGTDKERKKSFLGTPNFLAPEIIARTKDGHSYEVDIWALGIVMYSMLYSKPPFHVSGGAKQAQSRLLYEKISNEECRFPDTPRVSSDAKYLILSLLNKDPSQRPNAYEIRRMAFFANYNLLPDMPRSVFFQAPEIPDSYRRSRSNSASLTNSRRPAAITDGKGEPAAAPPSHSSRPAHPEVLTAQLQQLHINREKSASLPASQGSAGYPSGRSQSSPKPISTANIQPHSHRSGQYSPQSPYARGDAQLPDTPESIQNPGAVSSPRVSHAQPSSNPMSSRQEVVASKSSAWPTPRSAFQRPASPSGGPTGSVRPSQPPASGHPMPPRSQSQPNPSGAASPGVSRALPPPPPQADSPPSHHSSEPDRNRKCPVMSGMENRINQFFQDLHNTPPDPSRMGVTADPKAAHFPKVFMSKWIDLSNKYGLGYELTNNSYGVHFNDNTTLLLLPDQQRIEHLFYDPTKSQKSIKRESHTLDSYPSDLKKKVTLLLQFRRYMRKQLHNTVPENISNPHRNNPSFWYNASSSGEGQSDNDPSLCICGASDSQQAADRAKLTSTSGTTAVSPSSDPTSNGMVTHSSHCPLAWTNRDPAHNLLYLNKFIRTKYAAVFRISHRVLQLNFIHDHSKLIIQNRGEVITYISEGKASTYALTDLENLRANNDVLKRLKYTRDVLGLINLRRTGTEPKC
ncbi:Cell cycle serine/threonine-protein kinase cdc5/MSD2 [Dimargaris cristalligena]|nr:Cell cycle serine/threonine-protein kinase cdc5/MSD2 [Dimargaris cristalligena]